MNGLLGFMKKKANRLMSTTNSDEPKKVRLGDLLASSNRAGRRRIMARVKRNFAKKGLKLV